MKTLLTLAVAVLALLAAAPAHAGNVTYDYDGTDVSGWTTWAWKSEAAETDSIAESRIRRELTAGFSAKGYAEGARAEADFLVGYHAGVHNELRLDDGPGPWRRRNATLRSYPQGVLVVDVFDAETGRLVWRGAVTDALARDPEKADARTRKAVEKLLAKFPPPER